MRLPCNNILYNVMLFTNYVCIYFTLLQNKYHYHYHYPGRLGRVKVIESADMLPNDVLSIDIETTDLQIVTYALDQVRWVVHDKYLAIVVTEEWVVDGDAK